MEFWTHFLEIAKHIKKHDFAINPDEFHDSNSILNIILKFFEHLLVNLKTFSSVKFLSNTFYIFRWFKFPLLQRIRKHCYHTSPFPIPKFTFLALSYSVLAENLVKEVNKKIFHGLVNLKTLSLYSNHISCVTPGAFDALVSLQSLNLIANPFNCNCHMAWFADWLRTKGFTAGGPRCAFPPHLKDRPIHALPSHEFRCTGKCIPHLFSNIRHCRLYPLLSFYRINLM